MKYTIVALAAASAALIGPAAASSSDDRFFSSLRRLDPETRLEQICDFEAMKRISRESHTFHPDRADADVISAPHHVGNIVKADGGAFRSQGKWYSLSFTCTASPDHFKVLSFSYNIGGPIPESKWASYGLWR